MNPLSIRHISLGDQSPTRKLGLAYRGDSAKRHVIDAVYETLLGAVANGRFSGAAS